MTTDVISPDLKTVLRRLKLSRMLDTLPERLTLARQQKLHQWLLKPRHLSPAWHAVGRPELEVDRLLAVAVLEIDRAPGYPLLRDRRAGRANETRERGVFGDVSGVTRL